MPAADGSNVTSVFSRARRLRSSDDVVAQIREAIFNGRLRKGDRLPGERDLCVTFGVSRSTLREALRILESFGAVETRLGAAGGIFVTEPDERQLAAALEALIRFRGATTGEAVEYGIALMSETAYWAAVRADETDMAAIEAAVDELRAAGEYDGTSPIATAGLYATAVEAMARASKNRVRVALVLGFQHALLGDRLAAVQALAGNDLASVSEAIREHNARLARVRMRRHLQRVTTATTPD